MYKPSPSIIRDIKRYDNKLSVKWNNMDNCWEVWRKMAWGERLITPIVESIYVTGGSQYKYEQLDNRIVDWLFYSDTKRKGLSTKWKWLSKLKFIENIAKRDKETKLKFSNIAKDMYGAVSREMINPYTNGDNQWKAPDLKGNSKRIMARSEQNREEYFK